MIDTLVFSKFSLLFTCPLSVNAANVNFLYFQVIPRSQLGSQVALEHLTTLLVPPVRSELVFHDATLALRSLTGCGPNFLTFHTQKEASSHKLWL